MVSIELRQGKGRILMVYVVYEAIAYEGCSEPLAVFSSRAAAEAWIASEEWWGEAEIAELEIRG